MAKYWVESVSLISVNKSRVGSFPSREAALDFISKYREKENWISYIKKETRMGNETAKAIENAVVILVLGMLTTVFVVCKLFGVINWSWWLVFLPLWAPLALAVAWFLFIALLSAIVVLLAHLQRK